MLKEDLNKVFSIKKGLKEGLYKKKDLKESYFNREDLNNYILLKQYHKIEKDNEYPLNAKKIDKKRIIDKNPSKKHKDKNTVKSKNTNKTIYNKKRNILISKNKTIKSSNVIEYDLNISESKLNSSLNKKK